MLSTGKWDSIYSGILILWFNQRTGDYRRISVWFIKTKYKIGSLALGIFFFLSFFNLKIHK